MPFNNLYKTEYIQVEQITKLKNYGQINGDQVSRELDAVILEKQEQGFDLIQMHPLISMNMTKGFILVFKKDQRSES